MIGWIYAPYNPQEHCVYLRRDTINDLQETLQGSTVFHKTVRELGLVGLCATDVPPSPSTTSSETSERHCLAAPGSRITLVPSSVSTLEAFRRMCMHRDSGVGMLAPDGTLKNHLCATDLQCLAPGSFHKLLMPVDAFLEQRPLMEDKNTESAVAESVCRPTPYAHKFLLLLPVPSCICDCKHNEC